VGRVDPEKGITEAMEIARRVGRKLRIAAKVGNMAGQRAYHENVFKPALQRAGSQVEYLGELKPAERDQLFAESYATLMPGAWPEPFGLVSIESLACGTPVLARRVGALPEIIREGVDGFFGDDAAAMAFYADRLGTLDRRAIRERVIERFSAARMTDRYEELYARTANRGPAMAAALRQKLAEAGTPTADAAGVGDIDGDDDRPPAPNAPAKRPSKPATPATRAQAEPSVFTRLRGRPFGSGTRSSRVDRA
jgi:hypothetical protein